MDKRKTDTSIRRTLRHDAMDDFYKNSKNVQCAPKAKLTVESIDRGFLRGMISDFCSNYFKISVRYLSKLEISVSASIFISDIHQDLSNVFEFRQDNRTMSVFLPFRNPSLKGFKSTLRKYCEKVCKITLYEHGA